MDADLGVGLVKKRVALPGYGKRGSVRTLVATRKGEHCFFLEGFKKNEKANVSRKELEGFKGVAQDLLSFAPEKIAALVSEGTLQELRHEDKS